MSGQSGASVARVEGNLRIQGDGEMARRIRERDWGATPLGPSEEWSEALVATLNLMLASSSTYAIYWGDEQILLYNDSYRALLHEKHPEALGRRGPEVWNEAWDVIGPQIGEAYERGVTTSVSEALIPILAGNRMQDGWYTYSFHPIYEQGRIAGVGNPGRDDTTAVLARTALQQSEARLSQVLGATMDAVVGVDRDWKISYMNPTAVRRYGGGRDLVGRVLWEEFPEAVYEGSPIVEHYNRAMHEKIAGSFETHYAGPLNMWIELEVYPTVGGIVTFSRDITAKRQAEQALVQREKQLALAVEAADLAAWFYDPARNVVGGDEAMNRLFGLTVPEAPAEDWLAAVHEDDRGRVGKQFEAAVAGAPYDVEYRVVQADGLVHWLRAKAQMLTTGGVSRMLGICEDVTRRKQVEEELRGTAERLSMAQRTGRMASWQWDLATGRVMWDEGSEVTYGRPASEMAHIDVIFPYLHEEDRERVREDLRPVLEGRGVYRSEFRVMWPDGSTHWIQAFGKAIVSPEGRPEGVVGINMDVTERKLAEAALIQAEKLAAVGRLASSIAHEINNPLEAVTNLLYLAATSDSLAEIRTYLGTADTELRRTSAIASQTLRFHKQASRPTAVTCEDLIESVLGIHQTRLMNARVQVEKRKRADTPVLCFDGEIRQVLSNLVGNAVDAMSAQGGRLLLRSRNGHDWKTGRQGLVMTVADSGMGMSAATVAKLFHAFFTTKGIGGTGLGLWISKEIVERHQGRLQVRSSQRAGQTGSVFTVFLPFDAVIR